MSIEHPYMIANWKMQLTADEAATLASGLRDGLTSAHQHVRTIVCPSFPALASVGQVIDGSPIALGAQDIFWAERGAFTGEVSPLDLAAAGVQFVIIGHSERRQHLGETDVMAGRKMIAALAHGIQPILCVGETADQRHAHEHEAVVRHQITEAFRSLPPPTQGQRILLAYEPIWAIGTGESASPEQATEMMQVMHQTLVDLYGERLVEQQFRFLYGGSVNPENVTTYVHPERFHGTLAATATLKRESFISLLDHVAAAWSAQGDRT